ncbi:MAG: HAD family hydrolase [Planctomycetota bacterium]|jgi:2-haloacid dehalogenase/putative hydrolase of the HAD superfamily
MGEFEGIFIDFYGTLASGDGEIVEGICRSVIRDYGLDVDATAFAGKWGEVYFGAIEGINGGEFRPLLEIERDTLIDTFLPYAGRIDPDPYIDELNRYLSEPELFEEVVEVISVMRLPMCIVSNADERELNAALAYHRLGINYVVSSERARSYKPDPGIFEAALELTGWDRGRVCHVGDSLHSDIWGAHKVGLKAAWVCRSGRISDIGTEKPDFQWPDLRPMLSFQ